MKQPVKFYAVNYPLSTILLILAAVYLYFISPFSGIAFFPVFFLVLAVVSFTHKHALIINDENIIYKPFPVFSKKVIALTEITEVKIETGKVRLSTSKDSVSVKRYFLKNDQWSDIVAALELLSKPSNPS